MTVVSRDGGAGSVGGGRGSEFMKHPVVRTNPKPTNRSFQCIGISPGHSEMEW
jgi:hypothetical protein